MSCIKSLYLELGGIKSNTGNWFLKNVTDNDIASLSWNTGVNEFDYPTTFNVNSYVAGNQIGAGPYIFINTASLVEKTYYLQYRVTSGPKTVNVDLELVVKKSPNIGVASGTIVYCKDDNSEHNIFSELLTGNPDTNGVWSGSGTMSNGFNPHDPADPTTATFNPSLVGYIDTDKIYEFTYTISNGLECSSCTKSITVPITVKEQCCTVEVNIVSANVNCNYTADLVNPNDYTNTAQVYLIPNSTLYGLRCRYLVNSSCSGTVNDSIVESTMSSAVYMRIGSVAGQPLTVGGKILNVRVYSTNNPAVPVTVDFTNPAYLTGCAGTVNPSDLLFNPGSFSTLGTASTVLLKNALCALFGATDLVNYDVTVISYSDGRFNVDTKIKHQPVGQWIGLHNGDTRLQYQKSNTTGDNVLELFHQLVATGVTIIGAYSAPCSSVNVTKTGVLSLDYIKTTYAEIGLNSNSTSTLNLVSNNTPLSCANTQLTANTINCIGSTTYLWSNGATTSQILVPPASGTYTVTATCSTNNCTDQDQITL